MAAHDRCACHGLTVNARRMDPTRTTGVRRRFEAQMTKRFRALKGQINRYLLEQDALSLRVNFTFRTSPEKIAGFMAWLRKQQSAGILGIHEGASVESAARSAWTNVYVSSGYTEGVNRAATQLRKSGATVDQRWIDAAFARPIHADRLGIAYTRTFSELKGITDAMDRAISRELARGLAEGWAPQKIASAINGRVDAVGLTRARVLARTEVINAHAEATLNSFQEAGVSGVEVEAEILTTAGACPECEALEGKSFTIEEARGIIPVHPNCRCAWAPVVKGGTGITLK